jgi:hypothetical protein
MRSKLDVCGKGARHTLQQAQQGECDQFAKLHAVSSLPLAFSIGLRHEDHPPPIPTRLSQITAER